MPDSFQLVESALEHLWDYAYLGRHPLVGVYSNHVLPDSSTSNSYLARGRALSRVLQDTIGELRTQDAPIRLTRERHFHDILFYCYVRGEKNAIVAERLKMAERTFYRHRKRAIEAVALMLGAMNHD